MSITQILKIRHGKDIKDTVITMVSPSSFIVDDHMQPDPYHVIQTDGGYFSVPDKYKTGAPITNETYVSAFKQLESYATDNINSIDEYEFIDTPERYVFNFQNGAAIIYSGKNRPVILRDASQQELVLLTKDMNWHECASSGSAHEVAIKGSEERPEDEALSEVFDAINRIQSYERYIETHNIKAEELAECESDDLGW